MADEFVTKQEFSSLKEQQDVVAKNVLSAQEAIKEVAGKTEARIKEGEAKAEKFIKEAIAAQEPLNRARVLGDLAEDYSGEYDNPYQRAMTDVGLAARAIKSPQTLNPSERKIARLMQLRDTILIGAQACGLGLELPADDGQIDPETMKRNEAKLVNSLSQSKAGRKLLKEVTALHEECKRAAGDTMDTATELASWVPTLLSADYIARYTLALNVAGLFTPLDMPSTTWTPPVQWARDTMAYSMPGEKVTLAAFTSAGGTGLLMTLAAKKSHKLTLISDEGNWDSIVPLVPLITADHVDFHAYCMEMAVLNGDTTTTHRDLGTGMGGGTPGIGTDFRKAFMGLRYLCKDATTCAVDMSAVAYGGATAGSFSVLNLRYIRGLMGVYGIRTADCAVITGAAEFVRLLSDALLMTMDKYGANASLLTGGLLPNEMGRVDNMPILVSECYPVLTDATGIYNSTGNSYYSALMVNHRNFFVGNRLGLQTGFADLSVVYGQKAIGSWKRTAFAPKQTLSTANSFAYLGYKFNTV